MLYKKVRSEILEKLKELKPANFRTVESYAGQLGDAENFMKKLPAIFIQLGSGNYQQYSINTYNVDIDYQIWIFNNIKRNLSDNIDSVESLIDIVSDKIRELSNIVLLNVKEAYINDSVLAYVLNVKYIPIEVI